MLHRMIASATLLLLLIPTVALADPPERGDTEYEEDVILLLGSFSEVELNEQDGVDAAATSEASGAGEASSAIPADP